MSDTAIIVVCNIPLWLAMGHYLWRLGQQLDLWK